MLRSRWFRAFARSLLLLLFFVLGDQGGLYAQDFTPSRSVTIVRDDRGGGEVIGVPYNKAIVPYIQKGSDRLIEVVQRRLSRLNVRVQALSETKSVPEGYEQASIEREFEESYWPLLEELSRESGELGNYEVYTVSQPIHYREEFLDKWNGKGLENYKAYLLQYAYEDVLESLGASTKGGFIFRGDHTFTDKSDWWLTRYVDRPVYTVLDGASLTLGFVGLDAVPDALNVFYSGLRGNYSNALLSASSLLLVGPVNVKSLKLGKEGLEEGALLYLNREKALLEAGKRKLLKGSGEGAGQAVKAHGDDLAKAIKSFGNNPLLRGFTEREITEAAQLLSGYHRTGLMYQADVIKVVVSIRRNTKAKAFGVTDDLLGSIASTRRTEGYAQIISNLDRFISVYDPSKLHGFDRLLGSLSHEVESIREGSEWVLCYMSGHADEFLSASRLSFEVVEDLQGGRRIADLVVGEGRGAVYYEFKSISSLPPNDFVSQFSKDMSRDNFSLDKLRWVFDGRKIKTEELQKLREPIEGLIREKKLASKESEIQSLAQQYINEIFVVK